MSTFAQFLAEFSQYMDSAPQAEIDAHWDSILGQYNSDDLTVEDISDSKSFALEATAPDYFTASSNGRNTHDVYFDNGVMQQAA